MVEELAGLSRVLAENHFDIMKRLEGAMCDVTEIADGRGNDKENAVAVRGRL
ncbi:MAG: hypothetical protein Kow0074_10130 [Candidatus Zixiibacteriota bacterium]